MTPKLKNFLENEGCYFRSNPSMVTQALEKMAVQPEHEFVDFYYRFEGPFTSDHNSIVLSDIVDGGPESIVNLTLDLRRYHDFDHRFLGIATIDGGDSVIVYDSIANLVYQIDFETTDILLKSGKLEAHWKSFDEFLEFYFFG